MGPKDEPSFAQMLISDVAAAEQRHKQIGNQQNRRDLVRTSFAAIEGTAWIFRQYVLDLATMIGVLEPDERNALLEYTPNVDASGSIHRQPRFLPLPAVIRLTAKIAVRIEPNAEIDFSHNEWSRLRQAIAIRNRITHPKRREDLVLSEEDTATCVSAMYWFLEESTRAMQACADALRDHVDGMSELLDVLNKGDEQAWIAYELAIKERETDD